MAIDWSNKDAVAQWVSARPTRNPITESLRDAWDSFDGYGSTMTNLFAIADVMTELGVEVPSEWNYRQSPFGPDTEAYEYETIHEALQAGATVADLEHCGRVFFKLYMQYKLAGLDY